MKVAKIYNYSCSLKSAHTVYTKIIYTVTANLSDFIVF